MKFFPQLKRILSSIWRDRGSRWLWVIGLMINLSQWIGVLVLTPKSQQFLPLHYTIYFGIDLTGTWKAMLWIPGLGLLTHLIHTLGSGLQDDNIWRRAWIILALAIHVILMASLVALLIIVQQSS